MSTPSDSVQKSETATGQSSLLVSRPSTPVCIDRDISNETWHAFDYFRLQMCSRFVERGYPIPWATRSMSVGLQEPAVLYALTALSMAEQALVPTIHTSLARPLNQQKRAWAVQMYSKAISCLREPMQRAIKEDGPLEPIILCCILFLVAELTLGNNLNAMRHARVGRSILDERLGRIDGSVSSLSTSPSLSPPLQSIRLPLTESSFETISHKESSTTISLTPRLSFSSLAEARSYLEVHIEVGQEVRDQLILDAKGMLAATPNVSTNASQFCLVHTFSRTMAIAVPLQMRLTETLNGFASWGRKFGLMYRSGDFVSQDLFLMQTRFFHASFTLAMCRASNERLADTFADHFVRTLDSVERLLRKRPILSRLQAEETIPEPVTIGLMERLKITDAKQCTDMNEEGHAWRRIGPSTVTEELKDRAAGVFEFGILPALFTVASKCRTSNLRHKAAQLLSDTRRREAINSSRDLSLYAKAIIHLEEQHAARCIGQPTDSSGFYADEVPEHARFLDVVAHLISATPIKFALSCTMHVLQGGEDIVLLEYECSDIKGDCRLVQSIRRPFS